MCLIMSKSLYVFDNVYQLRFCKCRRFINVYNWESSMKFGEAWGSLGEFGGVWGSLGEFGEV